MSSSRIFKEKNCTNLSPLDLRRLTPLLVSSLIYSLAAAAPVAASSTPAPVAKEPTKPVEEAATVSLKGGIFGDDDEY